MNTTSIHTGAFKSVPLLNYHPVEPRFSESQPNGKPRIILLAETFLMNNLVFCKTVQSRHFEILSTSL